jgi:quercetin dioxygenase-like cupin family protein
VSAFADFDAVPPRQIWDGTLARVVRGECMTFALIELDPGTLVPEHAHANEQVGVLVRGSLRFLIGGEERTVGPGETWLVRANVPHSAEAGPEGAVAVEVFSPPRDDWDPVAELAPRAARWP